MAVSLKTKLLWFDRGAAAFEKYAPGVVEQARGPGAAPHYVCPICVEGFVREDVANGTLTEEHVPPEALGERGLILTCKTCNNTAGTELDAHAHRQQTVDRARHGQPTTRPLKVQARIGDVVLNARYTFDGTAGSLSIPQEINSPQALAALAQTGVIPKGTSITVEHSGDRYSVLGANISWLRSGYLAAFALFGYKVVFDPAMQIVRMQILKNETRHIVSHLTNIPPEVQARARGPFLAFIESPPLERGLCVAFGRHGVLLPGPGDMTFYDRIAADIELRAGQPGNTTLRFIGWPTEPAFGDLATDAKPKKTVRRVAWVVAGVILLLAGILAARFFASR